MRTEITKDHGKVLIQDDGGVVMEAEVFNRIISSLNIDKGICHNFIVNFKTQGVSCRCRYRTFRERVQSAHFALLTNFELKRDGWG